MSVFRGAGNCATSHDAPEAASPLHVAPTQGRGELRAQPERAEGSNAPQGAITCAPPPGGRRPTTARGRHPAPRGWRSADP
ncbi:hypothetical protein SBRY_130078 [Actinacidiphila bryophytorum]|uniref:Uncharacterized protein n=1 Tax=Actinacidiphila bryophytorum TaxID=1436133 RepID=A0A9W4GXI1_9ACTN|nr:hypothetical protein SBRY_130078 [Actinacidiphila bryophytorum]